MVSEAVVLMKTNPLWTTFILAYLYKKEKITIKTILEIAFCILGIIMITKPPFLFDQLETSKEFTYLNFIGLLLALLTALATSFASVLISSLAEESSSLTIL